MRTGVRETGISIMAAQFSSETPLGLSEHSIVSRGLRGRGSELGINYAERHQSLGQPMQVFPVSLVARTAPIYTY